MKNRLRNKQAQIDSDKEFKMKVVTEEYGIRKEKIKHNRDIKLAELANTAQQNCQQFNLNIEKEKTKQAEEQTKQKEIELQIAQEKRMEAEAIARTPQPRRRGPFRFR